MEKTYNLDDLHRRAAECQKKGVTADVGKEKVYALLETNGQYMAADGRRLWKNPQLVEEIDILDATTVTQYYYLKNVDMVDAADIKDSGKIPVYPEELPEYFDPAEVVIFDHTCGGLRAHREVILCSAKK